MLADEVFFDFTLSQSDVASARSKNLSELSVEEIRWIIRGRLYIFLEHGTKWLVLETEIADYIIKIMTALDSIVNGGGSTFTVGANWDDCYITYDYSPESGSVTLRSPDGWDGFEATVNFDVFCEAFNRFCGLFFREIAILIPELFLYPPFCYYATNGSLE